MRERHSENRLELLHVLISDVAAIVLDVGELVSIETKSKSKAEAMKRTLTLVDDSGATISLAIWGQLALSFSLPVRRQP